MRYCLQLHYPVCWLLVYICFPFHNVNIFPQLLYNCLFHYVYSEATLDTYSTVYNYSPQYTVCAVYISFLFTIWYFFTITAQLTLQQCLQHILSIYIHYCLQLHYPVYWLCCLYMLPFHNVIFFHNDCTINSTTMFTAYPQHIHTVLFTITLPSIQSLLLHMLSFSQCDIFPQWLHNSLYNNVYSISSTYIYGTVYNYTTQYTVFAITYAILFTIWYFFTITAQFTLQQCYSIFSTYTYSTVYNYTTQYTDCAVYICYPFHNVIFFHNDCTIHSTTMFTAYPQHIHTVLFTIILPSTLTLLFIYASFTQCDIFSQLLHKWLYNNVYSISATYTYSTVYNYSPQYTDFAVYICFLYTMWHFFTITAQLTLQQCLQHILNIYMRYCLQLH